MTPSVNQSSGCCLRLRSNRPIPSFPCSSSISRSCELLLFIMIGPILRLNIPSLYIGCTLDVSLVRRITDLSWRADNKLVWEAGIVPYTEGKKKINHKQDGLRSGFLTQMQKPTHSGWGQNAMQFFCQAYLIDFVCRSRASASCTGSFFNINIKPAGNPWQGMLDGKHPSITKCLHKTLHMPKQGQRLNQQSSSVHFKFICKCKKGKGKNIPFTVESGSFRIGRVSD